MKVSEGKYIVFASDFHLGLDLPSQSSEERERRIVNWLDSIKDEIKELYLVGDIFDYWFEYGMSIPKGFSLFLSKVKELRNCDIPVYFFTGNHDMWMKNYFTDEYGIQIVKKPMLKVIEGKQFFIAHGDGLGKGDWGYKLIKAIFSNRYCQMLFSVLHPDIGLRMMRYSSSASRDKEAAPGNGQVMSQPSKNRLLQYAENYNSALPVDYFIFGHSHFPLDIKMENKNSRYINLGDWLNHETYAVFSNGRMSLKSFLK